MGRRAILGAAFIAALAVSTCASAAAAHADPPLVLEAPASGSVLVPNSDGVLGVAISGTASPGATITVSAPVRADDAYPLCVTVADAGGVWACGIGSAPSTAGPVRVADGAESTELALALLNPPGVQTDAGDPFTITPTATVEAPRQPIAGTGLPGASIAVELNDGSGCTTIVDVDGTWTCTLTALPTGPAPYALSVSQSLAAAPAVRATTGPIAYASVPTIVMPGPSGPGDPGPGDPPAPPTTPGAETPGTETPGSTPLPGASGPGAPGLPGSDEAGGFDGIVGPDRAQADGEGGAQGMPGGADAGVVAAGSPDHTTRDRTGASVGGGDGGEHGRAGPRPMRSGGEDGGGAVIGGRGAADGVGGDGDDAAAGSVGASGADSSTVAGFGGTLKPVAAVVEHPARALAGALLTGAAVLVLVLVPGGILEATLHENAERIRRWPLSRHALRFGATVRRVLRARTPRLRARGSDAAGVEVVGANAISPHVIGPHVIDPDTAGAHAVGAPATGAGAVSVGGRRATRTGVALVAVLVGAAAAVFVVPGEPGAMELARLFGVFAAAGAIVNLVPALAGRWFLRRWTGMTAEVHARWWALGLTVLSVLVSRGLELEPGFVFGVVIALHLGGALGGRGSARLVLVSNGSLAVIGLVAWWAHGVLLAASSGRAWGWGAPAGVGDAMTGPGSASAAMAMTAFGLEVLTAVAVAALSAPVVSLLPLRFLDGAAVAQHSKRLWAVAYAVAATLFALVLLPIAEAWSAVGGAVLAWFVALGVLIALSGAVWLAFRLVPESSRARGRAGTDARRSVGFRH